MSSALQYSIIHSMIDSMIDRRHERFSTMPPLNRLHSIPPGIRGRHRSLPVPHQIYRKPDDLYGAGFDDDVSRHVVTDPSRVNHRSKPFDKYISFVEVMADVTPGKPLSVIAQLRGVTVNGEFVPQPVRTPRYALVLVAKATIDSQEGFFAVSAGGRILKMRVGDAAGSLQEVSVKMPSYNPKELVVKYNDGFVIASA